MLKLILIFLTISIHANESIQPSEDGRPTFSLENESFPLVDLEGEPTSIVDGCINVISGDFVDLQQDFVMPGSLPLTVDRSYCSSDRSKGNLAFGWHLNLGGVIGWIENDKNKILGWKGSHGRELHFKKAKGGTYELDERILKRGITNNSSGNISGKTNLKNFFIKRNTPEKYNYTLVTGDGTELAFKYDKKSGSYYDLTTEKRPNGMGIYYEYHPNTGFLKDITVKNTKNIARQKIHFDYEELKNKEKDLRITITGSDSRQVKYTFKLGKYSFGQTKRYRYFVKEVERPDQPNEKYTYEKIDNFERVTRKDCGNTFKEVCYYKKDSYGEVKVDAYHPWLNRIHVIKKPLGSTNKPIVAYTFQYHVPEKHKAGTCDVYNAYNVKTEYCWNDEHRLKKIKRFDSQGHLYSQDKLYWGKGEEESLLKSRSYQCNGQVLFCKNFIYDRCGNVKNEKLYGNITGLNTLPIILGQDGTPIENGTERYEKKFRYSKDGRNLLVEEIEGSRRKVYVYYPERSLLASEYTYFFNDLVLRRFFNYDDDCNLVVEITDNGCSINPEDLSGVTLRKVKKITPTLSIPWGLPQIIEEYGIDLVAMTEVLEKKVINFYDVAGRLIRQDYYGNDALYAYSLYWEYDNQGNLVKEINAKGETIHREYDGNRNLVTEIRPGPIPIKKFGYDFSNRLIFQSEYHPDIILTTHYVYNFLNQKEMEIDPYGNIKKFEYDDFGRLIKTHLPAMINGYGQTVSPAIERSYDGMGNVSSNKDENGNTTFAEYTVRGQPCKITYPDGTKENFVYYFHGPLLSKTERNGCRTHYIRDYQDRILKTEFYSPDGNLLWSKSAIYDAFNLLEETDASGYKTYYSYDIFGRLIEKKTETLREIYEYDALGHQVKQSTFYNEHEAIIKFQTFDLLNQVIEVREEDSKGNVTSLVQYTYDQQGHCSKTVTYGENASPQIFEVRYNTHGFIGESIDPNGALTKCRFFIEHNQLNQIVPALETIDSLGNITIIIKDAYGREAICERKNPFGEIVQKQEFFHDAKGNLCKTVETVISEGETDRQVITFWIFDAMNRVTSLVEGLTSPDQKRVNFIYNNLGQLAVIEKPSGHKILHGYHPDGLLASYCSDHFNYNYEYDLNQRLISSYDLVSKNGFKRFYNGSGHLIEERQGHLVIKYNHDNVGRTTLIELPDTSKIGYAYQGSALKKVSRQSSDGVEYNHTYDFYDLSGNAIQETMIQQRGNITRSYDRKNRLIRSKSNFTEETNFYDSEDNLLSKEYQDSSGSINKSYSYDGLNQLIGENGPVSHSYAYDSLYNRLSKDADKYAINSLNQILSAGKESYLYDEDGNLTQSSTTAGVTDFDYDAIGRLISSTKNGIVTTYSYDSLNRRVSKATNNEITYFIHDGQNEIGAIQNNKVIELRVLGIGLGAEVGAAVAMELHGILYAPLHDFSGNVTALVGPNNQIAESYRYSAFGEMETNPVIQNPWRYCSKRFDEETGLIYFGSRYYSPTLGRWITQDPLGHEAGPNLYAYVCNSPLIHFDAFGLYQERTFSMPIYYYDDYDRLFFDRQISQWYRVDLPKYEGMGISLINGIDNNFSELTTHVNYLKDLGAENMYMVYNPTHWVHNDLFECFLGFMGFTTPPVRQLQEQWDHFFSHNDSDAVFLQICHSQGALHVKNALLDYPEELRKRIIVVAIAPAAYIHPDLCHKVYHYRAAAHRDLIPRIDRSGMKGIEDTIYDLPSLAGSSLHDHNFSSPTYAQVLQERINDYRNNYGKKA